MLLDKGVTVGEIITLKLTSGEEVLGKLVEETNDYFKLNKPRVLTAGAQGIGMAPYLFTVDPDKDIKLLRSNVTVVEATMKEYADSYTQGVTGIQMA
jgi:hypothetical protein